MICLSRLVYRLTLFAYPENALHCWLMVFALIQWSLLSSICNFHHRLVFDGERRLTPQQGEPGFSVKFILWHCLVAGSDYLRHRTLAFPLSCWVSKNVINNRDNWTSGVHIHFQNWRSVKFTKLVKKIIVAPVFASSRTIASTKHPNGSFALTLFSIVIKSYFHLTRPIHCQTDRCREYRKPSTSE